MTHKKQTNHHIWVWIALGAWVGVAIGAATNNMGVRIGVGIAIGAALWSSREQISKKK